MTTNTPTRLTDYQTDDADDASCDCSDLPTGGLACFECFCEGRETAGADSGVSEVEAEPHPVL